MAPPVPPLRPEPAETAQAPDRSCAGCTLCCKLLSIDVLAKPRLAWCRHCDSARGCRIYDARPEICRAFSCGWLQDAGIGAHWQPRHSKMVISYESAARIAIHVDPGRLDSWRKEPYYGDIKRWARAAAERAGQVIVWQGAEVIAVLPDRDKNLGALGPDRVIVTIQSAGRLDVEAWDDDDPRLATNG